MKFRLDTSDLERLIKKNQKVGERVVERAYDYFVKVTPYRTGNARNSTHILGDNRTILADYPYAKRLDTGWSRQAPKGMTEPTMAKLEQWTDQELRKLKNG